MKFRAGGAAIARKLLCRGDGHVCDALELAVRQMNKGLKGISKGHESELFHMSIPLAFSFETGPCARRAGHDLLLEALDVL